MKEQSRTTAILAWLNTIDREQNLNGFNKKEVSDQYFTDIWKIVVLISQLNVWKQCFLQAW